MTERVSSSEIMRQFTLLQAHANLRLNPEPWLCYKPHPRDTAKGVAARLQCRATIELAETDAGVFRRLNRKSSGLFLDLAPQKSATDANGNAQFHWEAEGPRLTSTLGLPDIQAFLLGYQCMRLQRRLVPEAVRPKVKGETGYVPDPKGTAVGTLHKFNDQVSILDWTFAENGSFLRIAKPAAKAQRSIALTLAEELSFVAYLELALTIYLEVGMR
jgi:hypothetical protein